MSFDTRYSRQIRLDEIGIEGQQKIRAASVLVIGAGALGCSVLQYLTAAGVGTIGILDNDWIDETNFNRQILYREEDLGKPKPLIARNTLIKLNSEVTFRMHFFRLDKTCALKVISGYDIIVDCTDNFPTRYLINDACVINKKPWVYGAVNKFEGQVIIFNYKGGPTLRCIRPEMPDPLEAPMCTDIGVLGAVTGIIGSIQAVEVIKMIIESEELLSGRFLTLSTSDYQFSIVPFERDPINSEITELQDYDNYKLFEDEPVKEITAEEFRKMREKNPKIPLIDLRDPEDNAPIGFSSIQVPHYNIDSGKDILLSCDTIVLYCRSGIRSSNVIRYLRRNYNIENLFSLLI